MTNKVAICIYAFVLALACQNKGSDLRAKETHSNESNQVEIKNTDQVYLEKIKAVYQNYKIDCFEMDKSNCPKSQVITEQIEDSDQMIMVFDNFFLPSSVFTVNSKNFGGYYYFNSNQYVPWVPQAIVPTPLIETKMEFKWISDLILLATHNFDFLKLSHHIKVINYPKQTSTNHIDKIFNWLARWNPKAKILLSEYPDITNELFCKLDTEEGRSEFLNFFQRATISASQIVKENKIKWINISVAFSNEDMERQYKTICQKNYNEISFRNRSIIQLSMARFVKFILDQNPNTYIFKAVPNNAYEALERLDPLNISVCDSHERLFNVGYFAKLNDGIDSNGSEPSYQYIHSSQANATDCIDVFMNGGMVEAQGDDQDEPNEFNENSLYGIYGGLLARPEPIMASSWATPMALSMGVAAYTTNKNLNLKKFMQNKMFSPIKNNQFQQK